MYRGADLVTRTTVPSGVPPALGHLVDIEPVPVRGPTRESAYRAG
ncbi:hypothetical protein [Streptomyces sp. NPDC001781]